MNIVKRNSMGNILRRMGYVCALAVPLVAGCASNARQTAAISPELTGSVDKLLAYMTPHNAVQEDVKKGVKALKNSRFEVANRFFEAALRQKPDNAHLHFLNALAYHMGYNSGHARMAKLAKAGYITTLKFDESNAMAAYFLGQLRFEEKDYAGAQEMFSYGLSYRDNNPALLRGLSAAAYYNRDIQTSVKAAQAAYNSAPDKPANLRNLIFASAATGDIDKAENLLQHYRKLTGKRHAGKSSFWQKQHIEKTAQRLNQWKNFHLASIFPKPSSDIVDYTPDSSNKDDDDGVTSPPLQPSPTQPVASQQLTNDTDDDSSAVETKAAQAQKPKMANVDVVILRLDEVKSEAKGINLLDGLRTTLSGTLAAFNYNSSNDSKNGASDVISNPSLNLMGLQYNLNIFNDGANKAEILARPSLLATEGSTSRFFAGGTLHVQLSSNNSDGSMVDIPIGITLNITPKFHGKDAVEVIVHAEHSFLEPRASEVGFTSFSQTSKTTVDATATMNFGETLILSGLSQRENAERNSSVPVLGAIPGVQYFFSRDEQEETKTSILILLTPRKPSYATGDLTTAQLRHRADMQTVTLKDGRKKLANSNTNAAVGHMNNSSKLYRQFRTGDMALSFWEDDDSLFKALERTMGFLYY